MEPLHARRQDRAYRRDDAERIARDADYASVLESDVPIIVQHTRLDSRQADLALITTLAYAAD